MNKKVILSILVLCVFCTINAQKFFNPDIQKELVVIDSVHNYDLNPHTASYSSEGQLLNALYEGLFVYDPLTLEPVSAIADDFAVSRNKKTWTFSIRPEATFSNGERITSYDIKDSWIALLDPSLHAPFASLLDCIEGAAEYRQGTGSADDVGIDAKNRNTLIVRLNAPTEYFAKILTHHSFSVVPKEKNVYSGAYVLKERNKNTIIFEKNTEYYDAENVAIPSIKIISDDDLEENAYRFNIGEAQWAAGGVQINTVYDTETLYIAPQFGTEFIFFKAQNKPWDDANLRNAVISAIPWDLLRDSFVPAHTLILPIGTYPEIVGIEERDIEHAKELLKEAGYEVLYDEDGNAIPTGLELTFAMPDLDYTRTQASILVSGLAEVGITLHIQTSPSERYLGSFEGWDADLFTYTWIGDFADPLAFLELFRTGSSLRETEWTDKDFDALLEEATTIEDQEERYEKLSEAEQYLLDAGIILPLSHPVSFNVVDTGVLGGWYPNALDIHPFKNMYFIEQEASADFI